MIHQKHEAVSIRTVSSFKIVALFAIVYFVAYGTASAADEDGQIRQFEPVRLMHPVDGWDATDFAVSFRWERQCDFENQWTTTLYRLQVAVTPSDAVAENKWDEGKHELSLILSHQDGAVEVDLSL